MSKLFVVAYVFDENENVLLIKKNRPTWQAGNYNGIGGKIEEGETPLVAMIREMKEETDLFIREWFLTEKRIFDNGVELNIFCTYIESSKLKQYKQMTDESLDIFNIHNLPTNLITDVKEDIFNIKKLNKVK